MELALYDPDGGYYRSRRGAAGSRRRLPDRARAPSDLRCDARRPACARSGSGSGGRTRSSSASTARGPVPSPWAILDALTEPGRCGLPGGHPLRAGRGRPAPDRGVPGGPRRRRPRRPGRRAGADGPFDGVVLANEVLDALPVHRVRRRGASSREIAVDARRRTAPGRDRDRARRRRRSPRASTSRASTSSTARPPRSAWSSMTGCAAAAADLRRGLVLLIDYGAPADRAVRPGPAARRDAAGLPPPPGPRRPVRPCRSPGPDRPCRRHGGRDGGARAGPDDGRDHDPGRGADGPRHRGATAGRRRPIRRRRSRTTPCSGRRSCACSTPARWAGSGSWRFGRDWPDEPSAPLRLFGYRLRR